MKPMKDSFSNVSRAVKSKADKWSEDLTDSFRNKDKVSSYSRLIECEEGGHACASRGVLVRS